MADYAVAQELSMGHKDTHKHREHTILGVPERFAKPRLFLGVTVFALLAFGLVMIYSSSSIVALTSSANNYDSAYYFKHQLSFALVGVVVAVFLAHFDYHVWLKFFAYILWPLTTCLLLLVLFTPSGVDAYGATRWLSIGGFNLQPAEFAKVTTILVGAKLCQRYFEEGSLSWKQFLCSVSLGVVVPLGLILVQPDKGTTLICLATLLVMIYLSGVSGRTIAAITAVLAVAFILYSLRDDYSRQRLLTMLDPWVDPYDSGYQLIQGFYAFGSGGLFGVGIGASRQKYSYLPMAYNDFIYAVIGEECGLLGTLGVLVGFGFVLWSGFQIARYSPDLAGRLIAAGSVSLLVIQLFINICGVLGLIPLSGKPVPFLSYGGSSLITSMMLVGLVMSVSRASRLVETESDRRRAGMSLTYGRGGAAFEGAYRSSRAYAHDYRGGSEFVGEAMPRFARDDSDRLARRLRDRFRVLNGGVAQDEDADSRRNDEVSSWWDEQADSRRNDEVSSWWDEQADSRRNVSPTRPRGFARATNIPLGRLTIDANGRRRIDLGPSPTERMLLARKQMREISNARLRGNSGSK